jgi:FtsZ-binding cell division protein ZapB
MNMEAFAKLEERISKAVAHIDALTEKCQGLQQENDDLKRQLQEEKAASTKREAEWNRVSSSIKEKIEVLLSRISNYEKSGPEF